MDWWCYDRTILAKPDNEEVYLKTDKSVNNACVNIRKYIWCYQWGVKSFNVKNNWNILEYSFNLISEVDELAKKYKDYKRKKEFEENLEKQKKQDKKESEKELNYIISEL